MADILKNIIKQLHKDYAAFQKEWSFYSQSYIGGSEWISESNVWRHARESKEDYQRRIQRVVYLNYCESIITIFTSHIWGGQSRITRETEMPGYDELREDADRRGNTLDDFMQNVAVESQIYGHVGVVIDTTRANVEIRTEADRLSNGIRPYLAMYEPLAITNWSRDSFGQLNWVRLKESEPDDADPFKAVGKEKAHYRTWTRTGWFLHDENGKQLESGEHGLGVVPFVPVYFKRHRTRDFIGIGQLNDIARINRLMVNILSYIEEFVAMQAFPFLAAPIDAAGASPDEDTVISTKHIYEYPPEGQPPTYVSPQTDPARFMMELVSDVLRREIYRLAKLEQREMMEQSGVAKQYDLHQTSCALGRFARNLEKAESRIMQIWGLWQGKEWTGEVDYPDNFYISPINEDLKSALDIRDLYGDKSPTFVSEHLKGLSERIEPKLKADVRAMIDRELEESAVMETQTEQFENEMRSAA